MKKVLLAAAGLLTGGLAGAQALPEVTVTSSRLVETTVGLAPGKTPVTRVSLGYTVNTAGLDLTTPPGRQQFEKRVSDAAWTACRELSKFYPQATPDEAECARAAIADAMVRVHQLEAGAARGSSGK